MSERNFTPPADTPDHFANEAPFTQREACARLEQLRSDCARDQRLCDEVVARLLQHECTPWRK